jgi:hypothetical protein
LALQEDTPSPDDTTLPDVQAIVSRAGPLLKSINETLNDDDRYANIKWRRSTTANVIDRASRNTTTGAGGNEDEEEDRKTKKIKVSTEKASISINELEKTLVKAFNGGEKGLKKVCWTCLLPLSRSYRTFGVSLTDERILNVSSHFVLVFSLDYQ